MYIWMFGEEIGKIPINEITDILNPLSVSYGTTYNIHTGEKSGNFILAYAKNNSNNVDEIIELIREYIGEDFANMVSTRTLYNIGLCMKEGGIHNSDYDLIKVKCNNNFLIMDTGIRDYTIDVKILYCKENAKIIEDYYDFIPHDNTLLVDQVRTMKVGDKFTYNLYNCSCGSLYGFIVKKIRGLCEKTLDDKITIDGLNYNKLSEDIRDFLFEKETEIFEKDYTIDTEDISFSISIRKVVALPSNITFAPELMNLSNNNVIKIPAIFNSRASDSEEVKKDRDKNIKIGTELCRVLEYLDIPKYLDIGDPKLLPKFDIFVDPEFEKFRKIYDELNPTIFNGFTEDLINFNNYMRDILNGIFPNDSNEEDDEEDDEDDDDLNV